MPRVGGVYSPPSGTKGVPNTTIQSAPYNAFVDDLAADANNARPLTAGGTGATNATAARANLGLEIGTDVLAFSATSVFGRSLIDDADAGAARATLLAQQALTNVRSVQMGVNLAGAADAYYDFFAGLTGTYSARIIRESGNNGHFLLAQTGTGVIGLSGGSGLSYNGNSIWHAGQATAGTGWDRLPNGLIIQRAFVNIVTNVSGDGTISLPTVFSNANYTKVAWFADSSVAAIVASTSVQTASTFFVRCTYLNGTPVVGSVNIQFIAVGT